jgi:exodeoxyribonuclease VII large subunit
VTVYEARGQYQLIAELIQLRGAGALQAKFEALKRKLQAEGLFEAERKRPLPKFPTALGLVTSKTGAALRDMLNILERRAPWVRIFIAPVNVQGPSAAPDIADAIRKFSAGASIGWPEVDVIIAARGGGSIEDLWAFNEEIVARAIFEAERPVVSAVGHEIDFTISDFVADLRAPTPSAAAELVVPDTAALIAALANCRVSLGRRARELINAHALRVSRLRDGVLKREAKSLLREAAQRLDQRAAELRGNASAQLERLRNRLARSIDRLHAQRPQQRLAMETDRVRALRERLRVQTRHRLDRLRSGFQECAAKLRLLGPQSTLDRGYSVTMTSDGRVVRLANDVIAGDEIETRVSDGTLRSKVV